MLSSLLSGSRIGDCVVVARVAVGIVVVVAAVIVVVIGFLVPHVVELDDRPGGIITCFRVGTAG